MGNLILQQATLLTGLKSNGGYVVADNHDYKNDFKLVKLGVYKIS